MEEKTRASQASLERLGGETEHQPFLDRMEGATPRTEACDSKLANARRLAWVGVKLCNSFLYRWFNLCEVGAGEIFYAMLMPRFFAAVDFDPITAPQEMATLHSRHLLEEHDFLRPANSTGISGGQSKSEISWRTPWLYLIFLLLVWLLLF